MNSVEYKKDDYVAMNYGSLLDSLLNDGKSPCWLVVKDEEEHSFTILGIGFHDLDLMYLCKKLQKQKYLIQVDSPPIVGKNGCNVSFDSVKTVFLDYGYNWENPESLLYRLLGIIKH